ncbi:MAG TPA: response regulator transcription factor [Opitutaceae bacterium]
MPKLKIFLADDHEVVRAGLRTMVNAEPDMAVSGEAADGAAALRHIEAARPDVAVVDVSMPVMSGAELTRRLKQATPEVKILALTVHEDRSFIRELFGAGANGYLLKRAAGSELVGAIRAVAGGGVYIDPRVAGKLMDAVQPEGGLAPGVLSRREQEVIRLVARGYSHREISDELGVGLKTIETYKARSMEKLGLETRSELIRHAVAVGWLQA